MSDINKSPVLDISKSQEIAEFMLAHHHYGSKQFSKALNEVEHLRIKIEETRRDLLKAKTNNQCFKRLIKKQWDEIEELKDDLETAKASLRFDREEIERLRAENVSLLVGIRLGSEQILENQHDIIRTQTARIKELLDDNENLETLNDALMENGNDLRSRAQKAEARIQELEQYNAWLKADRGFAYDELTAKIKELEDAHKRSGAKYAKIINELRSSVYANTPGLKKQWDEILNTPAEAIRQLDVKPRSWQITEEREEALHVMGNMKTLIVCPHCKTPIEFADIPKYTAVLRAMLEAEQ